MAVLPWGNGRSQANGNAEKSKGPSLDWFSRSTTEPSRQAINQLMKQHSRSGSGGSVSVRTKSRAGTPTSQTSQHRSARSKDSKAEARSRISSEKLVASQSRPSTPGPRPSTPARPDTPALERSDSSSKSLFQKGGLLRRKGSKMGTNLNTSPVSNVVSPPRSSSSRAGFRGREQPSSPSKDGTRRPSISMPFDFAHVIHGDATTFSGLGRIDESDLACQFDAIQARYRLTNDLGEPYSHTPETVTPTILPMERDDDEPTALPQIGSSMAPSTPPPPPPPKDCTTVERNTPADIRTSRSAENFSRPNPKSPMRPSSCHLNQLTASELAVDSSETIISKPLPRVPNVVHAVSTKDDTARPLIAAPLPSPPIGEKGIARHQRQSSSRSSLRHMSTFPSSRHPQSSGLPHESHLLNIKEEESLTRPRSDYEVSQSTNRKHSSLRDSPHTQDVSVEDWEVAIDSAWDLEDDDDDLISRSASIPSKECESLLTIEQPEPDNVSLPTTPLMTMSISKKPGTPASARRPSSTNESVSANNERKGDRSSLVGLGLGMETNDQPEPPVRVSRTPVLEVSTSSHVNGSPRVTRSVNSAISHSSSQESIILSIASSIMGTQRSSVSSISVSDYPHAGKPDRLSVPNSVNSPLLNSAVQKTARPDSNCLPTSLLKQMNPDSQKAARPDSTCLPSIPPSQRNSVISKATRPDSVCLPQEMLPAFPVIEQKTRRAANPSGRPRGSIVKTTSENESEAPGAHGRKRVSQISHGSAGHRTLTASSVEAASSGRQRSSTQNSKTRTTRVSYSLFPAAGTSVAVSSPSHDAAAVVS